MFGWRKKQSGPTEEELREACLRRLAEVVGLPEGEFLAREQPQTGMLTAAAAEFAADGGAVRN